VTVGYLWFLLNTQAPDEMDETGAETRNGVDMCKLRKQVWFWVAGAGMVTKRTASQPPCWRRMTVAVP